MNDKKRIDILETRCKRYRNIIEDILEDDIEKFASALYDNGRLSLNDVRFLCHLVELEIDVCSETLQKEKLQTVVPRNVWIKERIEVLAKAINDISKDGVDVDVPLDWCEELCELVKMANKIAV